MLTWNNPWYWSFGQAHIRELEEEVKLLKNLSHPNIVVSGFNMDRKFVFFKEFT